MTRAEKLKEVLGVNDTPEANEAFKLMLDACCPGNFDNFELFKDQNFCDSECDTCWEMKYEEIKVNKINYEFKYGEEFYYMDEFGDVGGTECVENSWSDTRLLESFNMFPKHKKKQFEYLAKKQLLERKLFIYSDLHGAEKIDLRDNNKYNYYIAARLNDSDKYVIFISEAIEWSYFDAIYFNTREDAEKAIELYEEEIKEILKLQRDLYKGVE